VNKAKILVRFILGKKNRMYRSNARLHNAGKNAIKKPTRLSNEKWKRLFINQDIELK
jgi:hypothetical protein